MRLGIASTQLLLQLKHGNAVAEILKAETYIGGSGNAMRLKTTGNGDLKCLSRVPSRFLLCRQGEVTLQMMAEGPLGFQEQQVVDASYRSLLPSISCNCRQLFIQLRFDLCSFGEAWSMGPF